MSSSRIMEKIFLLDESIRAVVKMEGESVTDFMTPTDMPGDEKTVVIENVGTLNEVIADIRASCMGKQLDRLSAASLEAIKSISLVWSKNQGELHGVLTYRGEDRRNSDFYQLVIKTPRGEQVFSCKIDL